MKKNVPVLIEKDVPCTVTDGTTLYANIYRPSSEASYPVLLTRLPYNKNLPDFSHRYIDPIRLARSGYVVIIQDVRGRFASEGEFQPFIQEAKDGYDTVEWAAQLSYSNGKVGMFGLSYYGFTQLYAAIEQPPSLKAIVPTMTGSNLQDGLVYRGGAFELGLFETWMLDSIAPDYLNRIQQSGKHVDIINRDLNEINDWYTYKPINKWPPLGKHPSIGQLFNKYVNLNDPIHDEANVTSMLNELNIPAYHIAGWYDSFLGSTLTNFMEMEKAHRQDQKLLVGPWGHGVFQSVIGERFFGNQSSGSSINHKDDLTSLHLNWFDYWLKGIETSNMEEKPVHIFVMGSNQWRAENEWPLQRTQYTPFYFHSDGNVRNPSGGLGVNPPTAEGYDVFTYDPNNPVPTTGGGTLLYQGVNMGPRDQSHVEERGDVLVYTTLPLEEPLEVTGPVKAVLWVSSDASSTDFTAKLVDVCPDGTAYNLTDGIVRVEGLSGETTRVEIDLWATSNVFLRGHSIRVEVSSSNFPRYDVNPNTGLTTMESNEIKKAAQILYHGPENHSYVLLPIIPQEE